VGTPKEIYERPANLFVADFMGCENFFIMRVKAVESDGRTLLLEQDGLRFRLSDGPDVMIGDEITVTIRPDDIQVIQTLSMEIQAAPKEEWNTAAGMVNVVQYLGKENDIEVYLANDKKVRVRSPVRVDRGDRIHLYFNPEKILCIPK
jgi:ABC-type Fe3+/spermidine/putrescine transport system ATPase subunit